jgi:SPP1 family predicted phage head-tail adaptor
MSLRPKGNQDPGQLDRRVALRYPVMSRDASGGKEVTWFESAVVWAKKTPLRGGRLFAAQGKHYEAELTYEIRHRSDVGAGWQLVHGDDVYEITAVAELGREARLELSCHGLDQSAGAAVLGLLLHSGLPLNLHSAGSYLVLHPERAAA